MSAEESATSIGKRGNTGRRKRTAGSKDESAPTSTVLREDGPSTLANAV